jgi:hypothetical protein
MRCRALPGGTSTGRPARDDNPQARAIVQKVLSTLTQRWLAVSYRLSKKQIASLPILVSCLKNWFNHFLDELQRRLPD